MLDVFVVSLLAGLVHIHGFAEITAGVGIAAFGAVVVLTMLASLSFDPRLTWDAGRRGRHEPAHDMNQESEGPHERLKTTTARPSWPSRSSPGAATGCRR